MKRLMTLWAVAATVASTGVSYADDFVPPQAAAVVHVGRTVWANDASKSFREAILPARLGIPVDGVESVTLVAGSVEQLDSGVTIRIRTTKPFDAKMVLTKLHAVSSTRMGAFQRNILHREFEARPPFTDSPEIIPPIVPKIAPDRIPPQDLETPKFPLKKDPPPPPTARPMAPLNKSDSKTPQASAAREHTEFVVLRQEREIGVGGVPAKSPPGDPDEAQFVRAFGKLPPVDPQAPFHVLPSQSKLLVLVDDRTMVFLPVEDSSSPVPELLLHLLKRQTAGPLSAAVKAIEAGAEWVVGVNPDAVGAALSGKSPWKVMTTAHSLTVTGDKAGAARFTAAFDTVRAANRYRDVHTTLADPKLTASDTVEEFLQRVIRLGGNNLQRTGGADHEVTSGGPGDARELGAFLTTLAGGSVVDRTGDSNNLKMLMLAVHNYESAMGRLPFPGWSKEGPAFGNRKPHLSWRVAILPYIEQDHLYKQFKMDEPWDSEHNKKLIAKMPAVFLPRGAKAAEGHTHYRSFVGGHGLQPGGMLATVPDGCSNTFFIVTTAESVVWTKPDDMPYDPRAALPKLGAFYRGGFYVAMGDGSVKFIKKSMSENVLRALITPAGGEVVPTP